ncbi:MAG: arylsulfatase A-like enzyme [Roseivirga sp.]|jgi:arylsulfatase A-like enzyme
MNKLLIFLILAICFTACQDDKPKVEKPNIIYILADDLGYGELGIYGQTKIQTPNIDALAKSGMMFTQHYSGAPVCAPARYMLMTGKQPGKAYIRGNDEWAERGEVWNYEKAVNDPNLEGQRPIPSSTVTIGNVLQSAGYKTGIVGKWGLGAPLSESVPTNMGFDFFYGYNCQRQAHQLYPKHLWKNEEKVWLDNDLVAPSQKLGADLDPMDLASYDKFNEQPDYAPALMQTEVLNFIERHKDESFFMYYATPIPHLPIQVPQEYTDRYVKLWGDEAPYVGDRGYFPNRYPKAAYAGMITYLDDQVGEIVGKLKELGLYENTLIIFTSDNGPTYTGGVDAPYFESASPFETAYGRTKGFTYEGGIRVPMIATWPGQIKAGAKTNHISAFWDVMATLGELTNTEIPKETDGVSFLPTLTGKGTQQDREYLYWEFPEYQGQQAIRMGDWKGIRKDIKKGNMTIELYNLKTDPAEQKDIAALHPDIIKHMEGIMIKEHTSAQLDRFKMTQLGDVLSEEK